MRTAKASLAMKRRSFLKGMAAAGATTLL
ncbi:MAG: twin-arginine translocation signal domain-containing protein, partial [Bacteroidales bacterium]|nr:twin-arginine translocation signal domain-containing protein [Bacteroidales bacterium]